MKNKKTLFLTALLGGTLLFSCNQKSSIDSTSSNSQTTTSLEEKVKLEAPIISLSGLTISWNKIENATEYEVYVNDKLDATIVKTTYEVDTSITGEIKIKVYAISSNSKYLKSDASNEIVITTPDSLLAPVISLNDKVVSWNAVENAQEYMIYINENFVEKTKELSYQITSSDVGAYSIFVRACYGSLVSESSNVVTYKILPENISTTTKYDRQKLYDEWIRSGDFDTGVGEGFDMKAGAKAFVAHQITEETKFLLVSIRVFFRDGETYPKFVVKVDGKTIKAIGYDDEFVTVQSDASITFAYDLSNYVGETVIVEFNELAATHCCITEVEFAKRYGIVSSNKTSWTREEFYDEWYLSGSFQKGVGEGVDFAGNGCAEIKITPTEETKFLNLTLRMFENQDSSKAKFQVFVNNNIIKNTKDLDSIEIEISDKKTTFAYDLSSYINQEITLKLASINNDVNHCVLTNISLDNVSKETEIVIPPVSEDVSWNKSSIITDWAIEGEYNSGVGEGFDMRPNCSISKSVNITNTTKFLNIKIRMFAGQDTENPEFVVKVNNNIVRGTNINRDYALVQIENDNSYIYSYDLSQFVNQNVTITLLQQKQGVNHCVVQEIKLESEDKHTVSDQMDSVVEKTSWNKSSIISDWTIEGEYNSGVGEGFDMRPNCSISKNVNINESTKTLSIKVRMFVNQDTINPHLALKVNNEYVKSQNNENNYILIPIDSDDSNIYIFDLSSFVGQTINLKFIQEQTDVNHCVVQEIKLS